MKTMLLILLALCCQTSQAFSFPDETHMKKLSKEVKKQKRVSATAGPASHAEKNQSERDAGLTPLQLFTSPIQPGGRYMLGVNWMNVLQLVSPTLAAKLNKGLSAVDRYVEVLLDSDSDIVAFRNDPTPHRGWKTELKALKESKRAEYRAYVLGMSR